MDLETLVFVGDCHRCVGRAANHFKTRGFGVRVTFHGSRPALEVEGAIEAEIRAIEALEKEFGIKRFKGVCRNGSKSGRGRIAA